MNGLPYALTNFDAIADAWRRVAETDRLAPHPGYETRDEREARQRLYGPESPPRERRKVGVKSAR